MKFFALNHIIIALFFKFCTSHYQLFNWGKSNDVYFHPNISLEKDIYNSFHFYTNSSIPNNTLLLSIPYSLLITTPQILSLIKHKKLKSAWEILSNSTNEHINIQSTKEMIFIALIAEHFMRKQKGKYYTKFKAYHESFSDSMDHFPLYYSPEEISFIKPTQFHTNILLAKDSIDEEQLIISKMLNITLYPDDYLRYRVLTLSNAINLLNTTTVIPFINFFYKEIADNLINSHWIFNEQTKTFDIITIKPIDNAFIIIQGYNIPNSATLLYYGFTYKNSNLKSKMYIDILTDEFKKKINYDTKTLLAKTTYDIGKDNFIQEAIDVYKLLAVTYGYGKSIQGAYKMMLDNLDYYMKKYDSIKEGDYYNYIISNRNRENIRKIVQTERILIKFRIKELEKLLLNVDL